MPHNRPWQIPDVFIFIVVIMLIRHTKLRAFPVYMLSLLYLHFGAQIWSPRRWGNTHEKYGRICRRTKYDRCCEHEWTRCDRLFRNIRLGSRWEAVYGTVSWWVNAIFFLIASDSKYVRSLVFKFLSETQRWDPKSKQALLIKKSDHSRYLFTHLQRHIKET